VIEIERIINDAGDSKELVMWAPRPEEWKKLVKEHKMTVSEEKNTLHNRKL